MSLSDTHIKHAVRHRIHHDIHRTTRRHGRGHTHNLRVLLCQFQQGLSKHLLELWWMGLSVIVLDALTRIGVELTRSMPDCGILFGWCITISLGRVDIEELRSFHLLDDLQDAHQFHHVVSIGRTEITDIHTLKDILLTCQDGLQTVTETNQSPSTLLRQDTPAKQFLRNLVSDVVISGVGGQLQEVFSHTTHTSVNRHIVVVQHNQHVVGGACRVVDTLESQTAAHGTVANHRHNLPVFTFHFGCHSHTECSRDRVAGMSAAESVVFALVGMRKWLQTVQLAVGAELVTPSREYLMSICLMSHVPHNAVVGGVEHIMQRHSQFHHTKTRSQMPRIHRQFLNDITPQFLTHRWQLLHIQLAQVNRIIKLR